MTKTVYPIRRLVINRCIQFNPSLATGIEFYNSVNGHICEGCPKSYPGFGKCETLAALEKEDAIKRHSVKRKKEQSQETVRDEAKRRGVSIRQVRTERRDRS